MYYIRHSKTLKTNIAKIFITVAAISISETKAADTTVTDLDRNLEDIDHRKARQVIFDECLRYYSTSAGSCLSKDWEAKDCRKSSSSISSASLQKSCPIEDKKTTPVSRSFLGEFFRYISTFPPIFNMYTPTYKKSMNRIRAMDRKHIR